MHHTTTAIADRLSSASNFSWTFTTPAMTSPLELDHAAHDQPDAGDEELQMSYYASQSLTLASWMWLNKEGDHVTSQPAVFRISWKPLQPLRQWLDSLEVENRKVAHWLCQVIPTQCPFERDVKILGKTLFHIPPLCKLNPLYDEVVFLRFRAMSYLADQCGEDVSMYC